MFMWGSMWAAASDKPVAYQLGAVIQSHQIMPTFDPLTPEGSYIAYQAGHDRWSVGALGKSTGIVFDIATSEGTLVVAVAGNLRNIKPDALSADPPVKQLDK